MTGKAHQIRLFDKDNPSQIRLWDEVDVVKCAARPSYRCRKCGELTAWQDMTHKANGKLDVCCWCADGLPRED